MPSLGLIKLCYSGKYTYEEMRKKIRGRGGMYAHLGTSDCRVIEQMIRDGDRHADLIFQAQAYQIAKAIGLLSIVLKGDCDAIILTGGVANSKMLTGVWRTTSNSSRRSASCPVKARWRRWPSAACASCRVRKMPASIIL